MRHLIIAGLVCLLSACVTAETVMLDHRTAIISGRGDGYSSQASVVQRVMVEAATAAQARGFRYFAVLDSTDTTRRGAVALPTNTYGQANAQTTCNYAYCNSSATGSSSTYGGGVMEVVRPGTDLQVRFYNDGEIDPNQPGVWDAVAVLAAQPE